MLETRTERVDCECGASKLYVRKTQTRRVATLAIGEFDAHETVLQCTACGRHYCADDLRGKVPAYCKHGYDVMVYVGMALFVRACNELQIQNKLWSKNIEISTSEIGYLGGKFIAYLAIAHRESKQQLKQLMHCNGGYILHLDGTCEAGSPHLMSALDGISEIVLHNVKLPSENSKQIAEMLREMKRSYGEPLALVHDMGSGILSAVKEVFPKTPDYICHYHFLRDLGTDLFGSEHANIRNALKKYRIRTELRNFKKQLGKQIEHDDKLSGLLETCSDFNNAKQLNRLALEPIIVAHLLIVWILESNCELGGFGFPFDRAHLVFYNRLLAAAPLLRRLNTRASMANILNKLLKTIGSVLHDKQVRKAVEMMTGKIEHFDEVRTIMRIARPESTNGLNDESDIDLTTMEKDLTEFCDSQKIRQLASNNLRYQKMLTQIYKYWDKLFVTAITVNTPNGTELIQPQRTNNILERFFRKFKNNERKKTGTSSLNRKLKTMLADTLLVQNLTNDDYMKALLDGSSNLAERFAQIDADLARREIGSHDNKNLLHRKKLKQIGKIIELPRKIEQFRPKALAA